MKQADVFREGEGDAWLDRNRATMGQRDPVMDAIVHTKIEPKTVLEVGCSTGWRLAALRDKFNCGIMGLDPSRQALIEAADREVPAWQGTAAAMPIRSDTFDLVIYGFCLYVTDPEDWFRIAMEGDRVLKDGGHLIIHDFNSSGRVFARKYKHRDGILSYHTIWEKLWLGHPWYCRVYGRAEVDRDEYVTVLRKETSIVVAS